MAVTTYEILVTGTVSRELIRGFGNVTATPQESRTVLRGRFADQAALQGLLRRLVALNLDLVELRAVPETEPWQDGGGSP
ncbi:hypothetical protein [Nocardioides sp. W7]|uniref:hypothetical protein n=1 Tax=Nocardioides sp. W7 TaxID=2931390 RepID=UPI001FD20BBF|nr:hypothetical protein [Nocardioides sp. W7]